MDGTNFGRSIPSGGHNPAVDDDDGIFNLICCSLLLFDDLGSLSVCTMDAK